jgi:predicted negative regulator of RcsB-dependent stress response
MSDTTTTPNRNINQIIDDGDVGSIVTKNKNVLTAIIAAIVVAVVGFGIYSSFADKSKAEFNSKIYSFETSVLKGFNDKSDPKAMVQGVKNLHKEIGNYSGLIPVVIKSADVLMETNHLDESLEVLNTGLSAAKNDYAEYFILSRMAVVQEDLGQNQAAIDTIEKMNAKSVKIFEGKNYLDLGRLYLKMGNKEKAKASFTYVVEKTKDESEFVKLAKLYLSKM